MIISRKFKKIKMPNGVPVPPPEPPLPPPVYVDLKTDTVFCDGNVDSDVDGHPKVYMTFTSKRSHSIDKDINQVQCNYCGKKFIRK
tara:strand:+ start:1654 stop:1911 length:258 start_codon:yes stop_codon:yes gene_type:complete